MRALPFLHLVAIYVFLAEQRRSVPLILTPIDLQVPSAKEPEPTTSSAESGSRR